MRINVDGWHTRFSDQAGWTAGMREYLFNQAGLDTAQSVIEVGCGTGAVLTSLPESANVYGLDIDQNFLHFAGKLVPEAPLTCADAHNMPYPASSFDAACCHFLLLWVAEPLTVLREMGRITRPGGTVLALAEPDYGGRIDHPRALIPLGKAQTASLREQGANPLIGRELASLFQAAGLVNIQLGIIGSQWRSARQGAERSEWQMLSHDLADLLTAEELGEYQKMDRQAWASGTRVLYVPTFYAFGQTV